VLIKSSKSLANKRFFANNSFQLVIILIYFIAFADNKGKDTVLTKIFVPAEYSYIDESYKAYLLESYEDTYFPKSVLGAGKESYVKRNCEMIDNSRFCIVYYKEDYTPKGRKSGTKIAFTYAEKKKKNIIRFP